MTKKPENSAVVAGGLQIEHEVTNTKTAHT